LSADPPSYVYRNSSDHTRNLYVDHNAEEIDGDSSDAQSSASSELYGVNVASTSESPTPVSIVSSASDELHGLHISDGSSSSILAATCQSSSTSKNNNEATSPAPIADQLVKCRSIKEFLASRNIYEENSTIKIDNNCLDVRSRKRKFMMINSDSEEDTTDKEDKSISPTFSEFSDTDAFALHMYGNLKTITASLSR